jgi:hypothetical protein
MKLLLRALVVLACVSLVLIAEDFWVKKPYTDWSDKEAAKVLTNSPWAHEVVIDGGPSVEMAGSTGRGRGSSGGTSEGAGSMGQSGEPSMGGGGGGMLNGRGSREVGGGDAGRGRGSSMTLHVRWQSALPVRKAYVVAMLGHEKVDSEQGKNYVTQQIPYYVVAVSGLPAGMSARLSQENLAELAKTATLVRKDRDPVAAESAQAVPGEQGTIAFLFPKASEITLDDKEVEFVSKVGRFELRRKFKLKEMVIGDKLEL